MVQWTYLYVFISIIQMTPIIRHEQSSLIFLADDIPMNLMENKLRTA